MQEVQKLGSFPAKCTADGAAVLGFRVFKPRIGLGWQERSMLNLGTQQVRMIGGKRLGDRHVGAGDNAFLLALPGKHTGNRDDMRGAKVAGLHLPGQMSDNRCALEDRYRSCGSIRLSKINVGLSGLSRV